MTGQIHEINFTAALRIIIIDTINYLSFGIKDGAAICVEHQRLHPNRETLLLRRQVRRTCFFSSSGGCQIGMNLHHSLRWTDSSLPSFCLERSSVYLHICLYRDNDSFFFFFLLIRIGRHKWVKSWVYMHNRFVEVTYFVRLLLI